MRKSELLPILLLALSSNGDNVAVGLAYGVGRIEVPFSSNLLIAVVTGIGTIVSMKAGQGIGRFMDPRVASFAGGVMIVLIGAWVLLQSIRSPAHALDGELSSRASRSAGTISKLLQVLQNPLAADRDCSRHIDVKESWLLAIALSLNNVANGVAAGMVGFSLAGTTLAVMVFSVMTLSIGLAAGYQCGRRWAGNSSGVVSGLLLIVLGVYELRV
jgi:putative sporulation protein YtaF